VVVLLLERTDLRHLIVVPGSKTKEGEG
jgi:hypothetical protein